MNKFYSNKDNVKVCRKDICVEAKGNNGKILVGAFAFVMVCTGIALLAK